MKVQSAVIIDRAELRKKAFELVARGNALVKELEAYNDLVARAKGSLEPDVSPGDSGESFAKKTQEMHEVYAVAAFIQGLLEEEEVNPEDYGIPCVQIG